MESGVRITADISCWVAAVACKCLTFDADVISSPTGLMCSCREIIPDTDG
jgi:hypothetical protein